MKKHQLIALLCVATLLSGCGNAATPAAKNESHRTESAIVEESVPEEFGSKDNTLTERTDKISEKESVEDSDKEIKNEKENKINGSEHAKELQKINGSKASTVLDREFSLMDAADNADNFCLSPLSLDFALDIVANGANDETREEYAKYYGEDVDLYTAFVLDYMENSDALINNNLFVNNNYTLVPEYQDRVNTYLSFSPEAINFNSEGQDYINNWISNNTNHLLNNSAPTLNNSMQAVVVNTIYFNRPWKEAFTNTFTSEFNKDAKTVVDATFMNGTAEYYINVDDGDMIGFAKDYDERYQFIALLPNSYDISYSSIDFENVLENMYEVETDITMPKFSFTTHSELNPVLDRLGYSKLLTGLDNIIEGNSLYIDTIYQDCVITVDENGTEAAAATIGTLKTVSMRENPSVVLDRPFVFVIYDTAYNVPLFIGSVSNP